MLDMQLQALPLPGLFCVRQRRHADARGEFSRLFCQGSLALAGQAFQVRQINHSITHARGTVRGLHYQGAGQPEAKLITCLQGAVWDVAVDLNPASPTFLRWHAERLEAGDGRALLIPEGFAHGFQALTDDARLLYLHSADYAPAHEGGLSPTDPRLGIDWPLPVENLSPRDAAHPLLDEHFPGVSL